MNTCGECTECCHAQNLLPDEGIKYEWGSSCEKVCSTGCSIYESPERPNICGQWVCSYIKYNLEDKYRPDRYGMIAEGLTHKVLIWPLRHGQNKVAPEEWSEEHSDKIDELLNQHPDQTECEIHPFRETKEYIQL